MLTQVLGTQRNNGAERLLRNLHSGGQNAKPWRCRGRGEARIQLDQKNCTMQDARCDMQVRWAGVPMP